MDMGVVPLTIAPSDSIAIFLNHVPISLCFTGLEGLIPKEVMLTLGDTTTISLSWKLRMPPSHYALLMPLN